MTSGYYDAATGRWVGWPDPDRVPAPSPDEPDNRTNERKPAPQAEESVREAIRTTPGQTPALALDDLVAFLRRYVVMTETQADAVALWTAHTHAVAASETTPYLAVTSAVKRSGKTRLREVLGLLVHEPLSASNISDAAIFRAIDKLSPTLLLDEADAVFKAREREELRGLLNAGYRRGALAYRMGG